MSLQIYTETKKFSNTLQIRIFIKEIHVEITQTKLGIFFAVMRLQSYPIPNTENFHLYGAQCLS